MLGIFIFFLTQLASTNSGFQIIENGHLFGEMIDKVPDGSEWYAVIPGNGETEIKKVTIRVSKKQLHIGGDEFREVSSLAKSLFMLRGAGLSTGTVKSLSSSPRKQENIFKLYDPQEVKFNEKKIKIYSTYGVSKEQWEKTKLPRDAGNHKVVIEYDKEVFSLPVDYGYPCQLKWMADLNKDGVPEVFVGAHKMDSGADAGTLFLSEKKNGKYQMTKVGSTYGGYVIN